MTEPSKRLAGCFGGRGVLVAIVTLLSPFSISIAAQAAEQEGSNALQLSEIVVRVGADNLVSTKVSMNF